MVIVQKAWVGIIYIKMGKIGVIDKKTKITPAGQKIKMVFLEIIGLVFMNIACPFFYNIVNSIT